MLPRLVAGLLGLVLSIMPVLAEDWTATKLRGIAEIETNGEWTSIARGAVVAENQLVRTHADSRLELRRGEETIALGPNTQMRIEEAEDLAHTTVHHDFGLVEIEAEAKAVEHFTVQTEFLAAVVKGTRFSVLADKDGVTVDVTEGLVAVEAAQSRQSTSLPAGTQGRVGTRDNGNIEVRISDTSGTANIRMPTVFDAQGVALPPRPAVLSGDSGSALRPSLQLAGSGDRLLTAEASPSAGLGLPLTLPLASTETVAQPSSGIDIATTGIGIAIGIMLGSLALLLRRFLS